MRKPRIKVPLPHSTKPGGNAMTVTDGRWWALDEEKKRGDALWQTMELLTKEHQSRHMLDALHLGLYENSLPYWMPNRAALGSDLTFVEGGGRRIPVNLVKSVIDTAAAMLSKNTAEVKAFTNGGTWRDQKKARNVTKYLSGGFHINGFHRHQQRSFIDGCWTRARGAVKFWGDHTAGMVRCQRVHPRTLLWNSAEGDNPMSFYQHAPVAKETLLKLHGGRSAEIARKIEKAKASVNPVNPAYRKASSLHEYAHMVDVAEAWHKGYRNEEDSGRHILMIEGQVLIDEPWPLEMFPFATFSWDDSDEDWGGRPLAEQLAGYQTEIGRYLRIYRKALERAASLAGVWVERTSETAQGLQGEGNNGEPWTPREYVGKAPVFAAPPALGADFFNFLLWQYDKAFAEAGFSMMQSQGEKPEGLDAGVALREFNDITATRQVVKGQRYERQTEDAARIFMALSRQLFTGDAKRGIPAVKDLKVRAPGTKFLETINFADIDMEEEAYTWKTSATSALPTHFVGRMQTVNDMIRSGVLPKAEVENGLGLRLLNMPDLEKEVNVITAARELASMQVDEALYEGKYIQPEPYQDPVLLLQTAQNSYLHACTLPDVPKRNMRLLERLIAQADSMMRRAQQQRTPQVQGDPAAAMGAAVPPGGAPQPMMPGQAPVPAMPTGQPVIPLQPNQPLPAPAVPSVAPAGAMV